MRELVEYGFEDPKETATTRVYTMRRGGGRPTGRGGANHHEIANNADRGNLLDQERHE